MPYLKTPRLTAALHNNQAAQQRLNTQTLTRRLAGQWPNAVLLLWDNLDLLDAFYQDAAAAQARKKGGATTE